MATNVTEVEPDRRGQFGRRLALKPYGDELLTRGADFWIFSARLIIFTMALAEAIAWGYMGSLMSRSQPLLTAILSGGFVFILIWIVDATFMSLDTSRAFYDRALTGQAESPWHAKLKLAGGIAARVVIVAASLFITAPFLAQAIFAGDVADEITRRNAQAVASKRIEIERPFLERMASLREEQKTLEQQRVNEAAGTGLSGKYGRGPALETIEQQLADKRAEIAAVESSRASSLSNFDATPRTQLEQRYGVEFITSGVQSSSEVLGSLMARPEFTGAELAVRAFLVFLFLGLLILKIFQPRSVAVYFSERLHSVHDEYRKGLFDASLPEAERAGSGNLMDPLRFEDWCVATYAKIRREDDRRRESASEAHAHDVLIEQLQRLETVTRSELEPLARRHDAALAALEELAREMHTSRSSADVARSELSKVEATYDSMMEQIRTGGLDGTAFTQAMVAAREIEERRRSLAATLREAERAVESCTIRQQARERDATMLRDEIETKQVVIADAQRRIGNERLKLAGIVEGQRGRWTSDQPDR